MFYHYIVAEIPRLSPPLRPTRFLSPYDIRWLVLLLAVSQA